MPSQKVAEITSRINVIHNKKNADYADNNNPFSNFEQMGIIASWFNDPVHKSFANMIGVKLSRLAQLLNGKIPNNESIDDSFLDLCTYCVLFHAYYLEKELPLNEAKQELLKNQESYGRCSGCNQDFSAEARRIKVISTNSWYHERCLPYTQAQQAINEEKKL